MHSFINNKATLDNNLGASFGIKHWQLAKVAVLEKYKASFLKISKCILGELMSWKVKGLNQPCAFFNQHGRVISKSEVKINQSMRDKLQHKL